MIWTHFGIPKYHLWVATHTCIYRYGPHLGPHLGVPRGPIIPSSYPVVPYVPPYALYAPLAYHMDVSTDTPYVDTIWDGLQEGLQNPPNTEIPPVSTYSRSTFRPCEIPDPTDPSLHHIMPFTRNYVQEVSRYQEPRLRGILLPGTTFKRYPVTRNHV